MTVRILIAGCGDIGTAVGTALAAQGHQVVGLRRSAVASDTSGICYFQADLTRPETLHDLPIDFECHSVIDAFKYGNGRDLTGYEDGTENPQGDDAIKVAFVQGMGAGMDGSSFVAVQTWVHDFTQFNAMSSEQQDNSIGRRVSDNEELDDAPLSAHVKRTAQEDFSPEAFLLRRSMPWANATSEGLQFVAFDRSFNSFEAQLKRMVGEDDGISDALFTFTRPVTGSYFWCPPMREGRLDLTAVGL